MIELLLCCILLSLILSGTLVVSFFILTILSVSFINLMINFEQVYYFASYYDSFNCLLIFLSLILILYCLWLRPQDIGVELVMLRLGLINCIYFTTTNILLFFIFFELSLLPFLWLIMLRGTEPERLQGLIYIAMYTLTASTPFLLIIIYLMINNFSSCTPLLGNIYRTRLWFVGLVIIPFLVKLPIFGLHRWLPLAHVFSPVVGSIFLAGVILKVGVWGLHIVRMHIIATNLFLLWLIGCIALAGGILTVLTGVTQTDLKRVVAYSSITHMSCIVILITIGGLHSVFAYVCICISHGLVRPILFRLVDAITIRSGRRSINYNQGLKAKLIVLSWVWFVTLALNAGMPPRVNFFGEFTVISVLYFSTPLVLLIFLLSFVGRGIYNSWLWCTLYTKQATSYTKMNFGHHIDYWILFLNFFLVVTSTIIFAK